MEKYILSAIIFSTPLYWLRFSLFGIPTNVFEIVLYAGFVFWLLFFYKSRLKKFTARPFAVFRSSQAIVITLWLSLGLVSALMNPDVLSGLGYWRAFFVDGLLVYIMVTTSRRYSLVEKALILTGGMVALVSLFSASGWHSASDGRWLGWYGFDVSASANYLSLFLAPILSLSVVGAIKYQKAWRAISIVAALAMAIALFGAQSRGAVVALVGSLVLGGAYILVRHSSLGHKIKYKKFALVALAVVMVGIVFYFARPDFSASPDAGRVATSNNVRWEIWRTTFEIIKEKPLLGVGLGNYQNYFATLTQGRVNYEEFIGPFALTAHNLFLHVWASMGGLALLVFVWWLYILFRASYRMSAKEVAMPLVFLLAMLFYGLIDTPIFKNDLAILWWLAASLMAYRNSKKKI